MKEMEEYRRELAIQQAKYEKQYGVPKLTPGDVLRLKQQEREAEICAKCCGQTCAKPSNQYMELKVKPEQGQLYFVNEECEYGAAMRLTKESRRAGVPARYASKTYADYYETADNALALKAAQEYNGAGADWLYLFGGCGTGKTFLTSLLAKELIKRGKEVIFRDYATILEELKESFGDSAKSTEKIFDKYKDCEVLILDDVGTGYFRDWGVATLHRLINHRYNEEKATIITSNYSLSQLYDRLSVQEEYAAARITSRLSEMCRFFKMGEVDWRYE